MCHKQPCGGGTDPIFLGASLFSCAPHQLRSIDHAVKFKKCICIPPHPNPTPAQQCASTPQWPQAHAKGRKMSKNGVGYAPASINNHGQCNLWNNLPEVWGSIRKQSFHFNGPRFMDKVWKSQVTRAAGQSLGASISQGQMWCSSGFATSNLCLIIAHCFI